MKQDGFSIKLKKCSFTFSVSSPLRPTRKTAKQQTGLFGDVVVVNVQHSKLNPIS